MITNRVGRIKKGRGGFGCPFFLLGWEIILEDEKLKATYVEVMQQEDLFSENKKNIKI